MTPSETLPVSTPRPARAPVWCALWLLLLALAQPLFGAAGGRPLPLPVDGRQEAAKAALAWVALLDAGKYDDSHAQAAAPLKKAVNRKKWKTTMAPLRDPLGVVNSRTEKSATLTREIPGAPDAQYAVVEFTTDFAQKPAATETVTLVWEKDGRWRVTTYAVR